MHISLTGARAFITAGGAGMGRATVLTLHKAGAEVFTCDIDPSGVATSPGDVMSWTCDVSSSAEVDAIFDEIVPDGLDILINNAGIGGPTKPVEEIGDDEWPWSLGLTTSGSTQSPPATSSANDWTAWSKTMRWRSG